MVTKGRLLRLDIMAVAMSILDKHTVVTELLLWIESIERHGIEQVFSVLMLRIVRLYEALWVSLLLIMLKHKIFFMLV